MHDHISGQEERKVSEEESDDPFVSEEHISRDNSNEI